MKIFSLGVILSLLLSVSGYAQWKKLDIGVLSGTNLCPYVPSDLDVADVFPARLGFSLGSFVRIPLSQRTSLDFGLNYTVKSYRFEFVYTPTGNEDPLPPRMAKVIENHSALELPMEINYKMNRNDHYDFYVSGGLVNSFGLSTKIKDSDLGNYKHSLDGFYELRAKSGVGFLYKFESTGLAIEPQLGYTFLNGNGWSRNWATLYFGLEFSFVLL